MNDGVSSTFVCIPTTVHGLVLKPLTQDKAQTLFELVQDNRSFLTRLDDYSDLVQRSAEDMAASLALPGEEAFGVYLEDELVGSVTLIHYGGHAFGLGYWVAEAYSHRGLMTASVKAVVDYAVCNHAATEVWAGIKHNNQASIALVQRLGFVLKREQPTHLSFCIDP